MACNWNKATKKDTEPKMIQNIVIQKKLHSNIGKKGNNKNVNLEEHHSDYSQSFNSVSPVYQLISDNQFQIFIWSFQMFWLFQMHYHGW